MHSVYTQVPYTNTHTHTCKSRYRSAKRLENKPERAIVKEAYFKSKRGLLQCMNACHLDAKSPKPINPEA